MNNSGNQFLSDDVMIKRITHKLGRPYGVAMLEFAIMAPIFLSATIFMYNFLSTLPKKQQVEIIARYAADAYSRKTSETDVSETYNDYIDNLPRVCKISLLEVRNDENLEGKRLLLSNLKMSIDGMFKGDGIKGHILNIIKTVVKTVINIATFGVYTPYIVEFLKIDKTISVTAKADIMPSSSVFAHYFGFRHHYTDLSYKTNIYCMPKCDTGEIHNAGRTVFDKLCGARLHDINLRKWRKLI